MLPTASNQVLTFPTPSSKQLKVSIIHVTHIIISIHTLFGFSLIYLKLRVQPEKEGERRCEYIIIVYSIIIVLLFFAALCTSRLSVTAAHSGITPAHSPWYFGIT